MGLTLADYLHLLGKVRGTQLLYLEVMSGRQRQAHCAARGGTQ